jgi:hypothetical protein
VGATSSRDCAPLTDFGLFVDDPGETFGDLLRRGLVLDIHGLMEQVQIAAGAFVLRKVYREMFRWGQTRPAAPRGRPRRGSPPRPRRHPPEDHEGGAQVRAGGGRREPGSGRLPHGVLSNAGTKVAFRCNYPQSRTVLGPAGRDGQDMSTALEQLAVGQAYVSTPERAAARKVFRHRDDDDKLAKQRRRDRTSSADSRPIVAA